jgi:O-antigen/teichoic acid export membrane protein
MPIRQTSHNLLIYGLATYVPSLLALAGVQLFTHMLSSSEYGYFSLWAAAVLTVGSLTAQWLRQSILRYWKEYADTAAAAQFQRTILLLTAGSCAALIVLAAASGLLLGRMLPAGLFWLYPAGVAAVVAFTFVSVQLSVWQADFAPPLFAAAKIIVAVVTLAGSIALVWVTGSRSALALSLGFLSGYVAAVAFGLATQRRWFGRGQEAHARFDWSIARRCWAYGFPFMGWFVGTQILSFADRFILGLFGTAAAVGSYAAI